MVYLAGYYKVNNYQSWGVQPNTHDSLDRKPDVNRNCGCGSHHKPHYSQTEREGMMRRDVMRQFPTKAWEEVAVKIRLRPENFRRHFEREERGVRG